MKLIQFNEMIIPLEEHGHVITAEEFILAYDDPDADCLYARHVGIKPHAEVVETIVLH